MKEASWYNADYFLRGQETKKSNYTDYRWLPEATRPYAFALAGLLGMKAGASLLDYGCARGYLVRALREVGVLAFGYDPSPWAIENCDPEIRGFISQRPPGRGGFYDFVICKDVLEHLDTPALSAATEALMDCTGDRLLIVVPLGNDEGEWIRPEDAADESHQRPWTLDQWHAYLSDYRPAGASLWASYHVPGIKRASSQVPFSTGYFIIDR